MARETIHKVHGSFSWFGLENLRAQAQQMEHCLIAENYGAINRHWFQLQQSAFEFIKQQHALLDALK